MTYSADDKAEDLADYEEARESGESEYGRDENYSSDNVEK